MVLIAAGLSTEPKTPAATAPATPAPKRDPTIPVDMPSSWAAQYVGPNLKDPASASYRDVTLRQRRGLPITCGWVNSKNSFGGYTGFRPFLFLGSVVAVDDPGDERHFNPLWNTYCAKSDKDDHGARRHGRHHPAAGAAS